MQNDIYTHDMNIYYMLYIAYEHDIHHNIRHIHITFNLIYIYIYMIYAISTDIYYMSNVILYTFIQHIPDTNIR